MRKGTWEARRTINFEVYYSSSGSWGGKGTETLVTRPRSLDIRKNIQSFNMEKGYVVVAKLAYTSVSLSRHEGGSL